MKPRDGHPYYETHGMTKVTREQADFCRRRVGGLLDWTGASSIPIADLLANAYFLGMKDAVECAHPDHATTSDGTVG